MSDQKTIALVTGASAGLGAEFCRQLAPRCDVIIAVARRAGRLQSLAQELGGQVEMHLVEADLLTIEGVAHTMEVIRQKGPVNYLVNNAGFSTYGYFPDLPIDDQRDMLKLHNDAVITLCRAAIPFMQELGEGFIINVSSLGAFAPGKGLAVYGASKVFLNYFSQVLQAELLGTGVVVQALCPGYIHTEFHDEMQQAGFDLERIPQEMWMNADEVVAASLVALPAGQVVVVPGEVNQAIARASLLQQLEALDQQAT
jgi:short-subunit dehydrogenase